MPVWRRSAAFTRESILCGALLTLAACAPGSVAGGMARAPSLRGSELCKAGRMNPSPLVVEWSSSERAQFEALAKGGLIVARFTGCELQVLTQCRGPAGYHYTGITPKRELEQISGADELYAKIPLGAARLEAQLQREGQIAIDSTVVGRYQAERLDVRESDLLGRCLGATHVVSGLTVGAFELSSGAKGSISADATVMQFGASTNAKLSRRVLSHDGDVRACVATRPGPATPATEPAVDPVDDADASSTESSPPADAPGESERAGPPENCGALIRIDLAALPEAEERYASDERAREALLDEKRSKSASRRSWGYVLGGIGLGALALGGTFMLLGAGQNATIEEGGLATKEHIKDAESTGITFNTLAYAFGISGGALLGVGVPLVILNPRPERLDDAFLTPKRRVAGPP